MFSCVSFCSCCFILRVSFLVYVRLRFCFESTRIVWKQTPKAHKRVKTQMAQLNPPGMPSSIPWSIPEVIPKYTLKYTPMPASWPAARHGCDFYMFVFPIWSVASVIVKVFAEPSRVFLICLFIPSASVLFFVLEYCWSEVKINVLLL